MTAVGTERGVTGAVRAPLPGARWHFHHGPIDLVLQTWGDTEECARGYDQAWTRFETVLSELASELSSLRKPVVPAIGWRRPTADGGSPVNALSGGDASCSLFESGEDVPGSKVPLTGAVARRMWRACAPFAKTFITPMAAVAGAVADEVLSAMVRGRALRKAYVNNGGDIALHLAPGERFETGIVGNISKPKVTATACIAADTAVRGIATSGWRGRSFSLGIADSVTVLARDAAVADAAATLVANAVNVDHPAIERRPARSLDPDSDLGEHRVTVAVGVLDNRTLTEALACGWRTARDFRDAGLIEAAYIELQGRRIAIGGDNLDPPAPQERMAWSLHA